jgi:hypothetical protein
MIDDCFVDDFLQVELGTVFLIKYVLINSGFCLVCLLTMTRVIYSYVVFSLILYATS